MTDEDNQTGNRPAREGFLFVCGACGKTSTWRYGFASIGQFNLLNPETPVVTSPGWDESCMLNASEVEIERIVYENGRLIEVLPIQ
jgi:hypothetical protein